MGRATPTITDQPGRRLRAGILIAVTWLLVSNGLFGCAPAPDGPTGSVTEPQPGFLYGRVARVKDGDSLVMRTADGETVEVRLSEIDTPEKDRPFADQARNALTRLVKGKDIAVRRFDVDRYDRLVGRVFLGDQDINAELLRLGLAAVYCRFTDDPVLYRVEGEAREARRGIWGGTALPRGACVGPVQGKQAPAGNDLCQAKRSCRQMADCDEAIRLLRQCGLTAMDGDGDGIPCERSLCADRARNNWN